ncbi:hypothetical protein [Demequina sp.]|uniref:hypothetical protein n=1 Tax=Demequina sp. TaxID=2050685 RepID=UPI003D09C1CA
MSGYVEWGALANIVAFGILIGAGMPALYAIGVRALDSSSRQAGRAATMYKAGAYACFGVVAATILGALVFIAAGGH